uniref:G_PROTEIN_RECEP_F1_2 domain-containing protein n=1 Tax=Panagrellus redivivus TaxID=6233 RepID=A0A7E4W1L8_PANRE
MGTKDPSLKCLDDHGMVFNSGLERILNGYIMPILILFGVTGNLINLTILLAPSMKTRSNLLLGCLAIADTVFLLCMLPHSLASYQIFYLNYSFRWFYWKIKEFGVAFLNWSSAAAIWLVLAVCLERLIGIRHPLSVRQHRAYHMHLIIGGITLLTFFLTFYHHFSHYCQHRVFCNGTQLHFMCDPVTVDKWRGKEHATPLFQRAYVRWSIKINAVFGVLLPTIIIAISNVMLIGTLRQRAKFLAISVSSGSKGGGTDSSAAQLRLEQRVTLTVCAIVSCFTITQAPSAVLMVITEIPNITQPQWLKVMHATSTLLVAFGKSVNFVLFCLSSANFRHKLVTMTKERLGGKRRQRRASFRTELTTMTVRTPHSMRLGSGDTKLPLVDSQAKRSRTMSLNEPATLPEYVPLQTGKHVSQDLLNTTDSATLL